MDRMTIKELERVRREELKKAERLERQAEGKSQFLREHLLNAAKGHRDEAFACDVLLTGKKKP